MVVILVLKVNISVDDHFLMASIDQQSWKRYWTATASIRSTPQLKMVVWTKTTSAIKSSIGFASILYSHVVNCDDYPRGSSRWNIGTHSNMETLDNI